MLPLVVLRWLDCVLEPTEAKALEGFFIDRMEQNQDIFAKFMNDTEFKSTVATYLRSQVYQQISGGAQI